jgi:branched-chain amino acid transport system permease protein
MDRFLQYFFLGLSNGAIYASLALALVILIQTMRSPNLAQGEMATFTTFVAWYLMEKGIPYWGAVCMTLLFAFAFGAFLNRVFYRPVEHGSPTSQLIVLIGLFLAINGLSGWMFGYDTQAFPQPFKNGAAFENFKYITTNQLFVLVVILSLIGLLTAFYRYTKLGLALRALSQNPDASKLVGINVSLLLMLNWSVSAVMGAIAGILVAPAVFLDSNMMAGVLIYAFAGCILGGLFSPLGAVLGSFLIAMINAMLFDYLGLFDRNIQLAVTFLIIVVILLVRPQGLLTKKVVHRM